MIKVCHRVLRDILSFVPCVPPETGGVIGGQEGIISAYVLDSGGPKSNGYDYYAPDTIFLNHTIEQWRKEGIELYGIFHTHFPEGQYLSKGDIRYINVIMNALPPQIDSLLFPIVIPRKKMIVYRARRGANTVQLSCEEIEVLQKGDN